MTPTSSTNLPQSLRVILVGAGGRIAQKHLQAILSIPRLHLAALVDTHADWTPLAHLDHIPQFTNLTDALAANSYDIAVICSPSGLHTHHVSQCLEAQIHVLCEKPVTRSLQCFERVLKLSKENGKLLVPCHQTRLYPSFQFALSLIQSESLGRIHSLNLNLQLCRPQRYFDEAPWRGTLGMDGGVLWNQSTHLLDWLLSFMPTTPYELFSYQGTYRRAIESPDIASMLLLFHGGMATISTSVLAEPSNFESVLSVLGDRGFVQLGGPGARHITRLSYQDMPSVDIDALNAQSDEIAAQGHAPLYHSLLTWISGQHHETLDALQQRALWGIKLIELSELSVKTHAPQPWR